MRITIFFRKRDKMASRAKKSYVDTFDDIYQQLCDIRNDLRKTHKRKQVPSFWIDIETKKRLVSIANNHFDFIYPPDKSSIQKIRQENGYDYPTLDFDYFHIYDDIQAKEVLTLMLKHTYEHNGEKIIYYSSINIRQNRVIVECVANNRYRLIHKRTYEI
jgi:hypothetical protein